MADNNFREKIEQVKESLEQSDLKWAVGKERLDHYDKVIGIMNPERLLDVEDSRCMTSSIHILYNTTNLIAAAALPLSEAMLAISKNFQWIPPDSWEWFSVALLSDGHDLKAQSRKNIKQMRINSGLFFEQGQIRYHVQKNDFSRNALKLLESPSSCIIDFDCHMYYLLFCGHPFKDIQNINQSRYIFSGESNIGLAALKFSKSKISPKLGKYL